MRTFWIQTLGCKVNQYESEQLAALLLGRGLVPADSPESADLRIVNTCSVTTEAAAKSRQTIRRTTRLPVLTPSPGNPGEGRGEGSAATQYHARTLVTGCWATSNRDHALSLNGVDAVLGHHDDIAAELDRLLNSWNHEKLAREPLGDDLLMIRNPAPASKLLRTLDQPGSMTVKKKPVVGTHSLPLLGQHQTGRQRAYLKIQDGCDAHCTYCIIPQLRPSLWSKPIDDVVEEARRLVDSGHVELILTGIFLGAYGQPTALRRRQSEKSGLSDLVESLCTKVPGLRRLRLSSLEPGDLTPDLIANLRSHEQIVPHFHLPLQSGSDEILRRMNRQYSRDDYLRMIDEVNQAWDRPAVTTDIIVAFPGETDAEFLQTLEIVKRSKFIHIHAFPFSPRPGTAAARWKEDFISPKIASERIATLAACGLVQSHEYRRSFLGETVELLVEHPHSRDENSVHHGRCERYFEVHFEDPAAKPGDAVKVMIDRVTPQRTIGHKIENPKLEIRNPKQVQNTNVQMSKTSPF